MQISPGKPSMNHPPADHCLLFAQSYAIRLQKQCNDTANEAELPSI